MQVTSDVGLRDRLRSAADRLEECKEAEKLAREQRDRVIVEALELEVPTRQVARWSGLSQSGVMAVLSQH